MKWFFHVIIIAWLGHSLSTPENCDHNDTSTTHDCNFTDHESYLKCTRKRLKRQSDCKEESSFSSNGSAEDCSGCDCNQCDGNRCSSPCCCSVSYNKTRPCCFKSCNAQCKSSTCRRSCRKSCMPTNGIADKHNSTSSNQLQNVTTIIKLQNVINNTNIIKMPVNVKNNISNATTEVPKTNLTSPNCCQVISPTQCTSYSQFPFVKCYNHRKHVCSNIICQWGVMYAQPHQICNEQPPGPPNCHGQIIYVPQPQPTPTWSYVIRRVCHDQHPSPWLGFPRGGFSSSGFGFSSPAAHPVYFGLPEHQFAVLGNPKIPSSVPPQNEGLPGDPLVLGSGDRKST